MHRYCTIHIVNDAACNQIQVAVVKQRRCNAAATRKNLTKSHLPAYGLIALFETDFFSLIAWIVDLFRI